MVQLYGDTIYISGHNSGLDFAGYTDVLDEWHLFTGK
jgi:hypothetical protein